MFLIVFGIFMILLRRLKGQAGQTEIEVIVTERQIDKKEKVSEKYAKQFLLVA
jgi:hypothetical protein